MVSYKIEIKRSAQKELSKLPKKDILKLEKVIYSLARNPKQKGSKKLFNQNIYRF